MLSGATAAAVGEAGRDDNSDDAHALPFQWDDGVFVSPFVATSSDDMAALAAWLMQHVVQRACETLAPPRQQQQHRVRLVLRVSDLGCGDGAALLSLLTHLRTQWTRQRADASSSVVAAAARAVHLHVDLVGIDLDEQLLARARDAADALALCFARDDAKETDTSCGGRHCTFAATFCCQDIRTWSAHDDNSRNDDAASTATARDVPLPRVYFLYLLPEATELLRASLTQALQQQQQRCACIVASNRWPLPFLRAFHVATAGNVHIYTQQQQQQ